MIWLTSQGFATVLKRLDVLLLNVTCFLANLRTQSQLIRDLYAWDISSMTPGVQSYSRFSSRSTSRQALSLQRQPLASKLDRTSLAYHIGSDSNLLFRPIPMVELDNFDFQIFEATLAFVYDVTHIDCRARRAGKVLSLLCSK